MSSSFTILPAADNNRHTTLLRFAKPFASLRARVPEAVIGKVAISCRPFGRQRRIKGMKVGGGVMCLAVASGLAAVAAGLFGVACGEVQAWLG